MVEFCTACGTSLPKGDLTFKGGELFTSRDFTCPDCGDLANPSTEAATPVPTAEKDVVIKKGKVE